MDIRTSLDLKYHTYQFCQIFGDTNNVNVLFFTLSVLEKNNFPIEFLILIF